MPFKLYNISLSLSDHYIIFKISKIWNHEIIKENNKKTERANSFQFLFTC